MESNLLTLAKQYQKQRKWEKAIEYFEQYMDNDDANCTDTVYTSYAKCLRMFGQTNCAKVILQKGNALYPQSESILVEFFNLYDYLGDWEAEKSIASTLIDIDPTKADYYFKLGMAYSSLNNKKQAEKIYKIGLTYKHGLSFESLIEKIQKGFTDKPNEVTSEYIFLSGKNNLGAVLHEYRGKKYLTKISQHTRGARREEIFYKEICTQFPVLKEVVPLYIDSQTIDKVQYLTIEMIEAAQATASINNVINVSQQISAVTYHEIVKNYPNPNYLFSFRSRPITIVIFFTQIHKKYYNQKLFSALRTFTKQKNHPEKVVQIIQQLESLIMDNLLYKFIKPEKHYSLLHGDFMPGNMKMKKDDESLQVFDWATFTTAPHFIDIARYFAATRIPYSDVKEMYLFKEQANKKLSLIEQIFFLYSFILFHFVTLLNKNINQDKIVSELIQPALADMRTCVSQFKQDKFGFAMQSLLDDNKETVQQNMKLKKKISRLEMERSKIQIKLKNILNSKSWKMTAPVRRFIERRKKNKSNRQIKGASRKTR